MEIDSRLGRSGPEMWMSWGGKLDSDSLSVVNRLPP